MDRADSGETAAEWSGLDPIARVGARIHGDVKKLNESAAMLTELRGAPDKGIPEDRQLPRRLRLIDRLPSTIVMYDLMVMI